jgi:glycosyltransferase involved in cell wall biosynthesis
MYCLGNEIPPLVVRWYGRQRIEAFVQHLQDIAKEESLDTLTTYVNHPPTEYLQLPFIDVVSYNIYLEREPEFRAYLARLQALSGERPLFLAELGLDAQRHGEATQATVLAWQLRAIFEKGLCGAAVYSWTDDWTIFDEKIEGWGFGLTSADRSPKPALEAVSDVYKSDLYELSDHAWPRVSVVVCTYNGGKTLDETLKSLSSLSYPDYEVIVVDDGSTDNTSRIAQDYAVRYVKVANGGLSRARNMGIEAATGEIVAFIDSDAYADPDWLYYLATAMESCDAVAAGGPNLQPASDGFVAQCIDRAPGNPTHVLLDDDQAEHIAGCNMAFKRESIRELGLFNPRHNVAGDDVDVCWRIIAKGGRIAYSPSAVVWHHRRESVGAFLRQQQGYGRAEAHLQAEHPGRFNVFNDLVWGGRVYDRVGSMLSNYGLPAFFRTRVYQGKFGGGQFQSLYQPFERWWLQLFTTVEWQVVSWCVFVTSLLAFQSDMGMGIAWLGLTGLLAAPTLGAAAVPAMHAVKDCRWRGVRRWKGALLVMLLHIVQPLRRSLGRLRGAWETRGRRKHTATVHRLWGNLHQRALWLDAVQAHLRRCGWICQPSDDWDEADLDILGPGPYRLALCSIYEEHLERGWHHVRFRITARMKGLTVFYWLALSATVPLFWMAPYLSPLALPLGLLAYRLAMSKRHMIAAASQVALDSAEPLGMTTVEESGS